MNNQEQLNLLKQVLTMLGSLLTMYGVMNASQASALSAAVTVAAPALVTIGSIAWSIYSHWNMKKVPETAQVIPAPTPAPTVTK